VRELRPACLAQSFGEALVQRCDIRRTGEVEIGIADPDRYFVSEGRSGQNRDARGSTDRSNERMHGKVLLSRKGASPSKPTRFAFLQARVPRGSRGGKCKESNARCARRMKAAPLTAVLASGAAAALSGLAARPQPRTPLLLLDKVHGLEL
jgi:hypothetical protein